MSGFRSSGGFGWIVFGLCAVVVLRLCWPAAPADKDVRVQWSRGGGPNQYQVYDVRRERWLTVMLPHSEIGVQVSQLRDGKWITGPATPSRPGHPSTPDDFSLDELTRLAGCELLDILPAADGMLVVHYRDGAKSDCWTVWTPALLEAVLAFRDPAEA